MQSGAWRLLAAVLALLPTMYSPCGWDASPGYCTIEHPKSGVGFTALAHLVLGNESPTLWPSVFESALLVLAIPLLLVAAAIKLRSRHAGLVAVGVLSAFGLVNVLANALSKMIGGSDYVRYVLGLETHAVAAPSIWIGLSMLGAAYALRRAARQPQAQEARA
ncbi:hypothetical protein HNP84_000492 [Thermocatellispora tengchongensis]|uniref:DUF3995 domain-containing protein n=1 Tax=Thermocatellispora tengchongensis TaxID=1073253 RepID=A0A840NQE6_9ACTN|nr:hypothetical protein [Thermocatellispora tengchongensis]MBB5130804.1 hypothetical protein [Thermocatellispora tengchongensis]